MRLFFNTYGIFLIQPTQGDDRDKNCKRDAFWKAKSKQTDHIS